MLQQCTKKTLTTDPFSNTRKEDEVLLEVEAGVLAGLKCLQLDLGQRSMIVLLNREFSTFGSLT
jgi:hypothetical protein